MVVALVLLAIFAVWAVMRSNKAAASTAALVAAHTKVYLKLSDHYSAYLSALHARNAAYARSVAAYEALKAPHRAFHLSFEAYVKSHAGVAEIVAAKAAVDEAHRQYEAATPLDLDSQDDDRFDKYRAAVKQAEPARDVAVKIYEETIISYARAHRAPGVDALLVVYEMYVSARRAQVETWESNKAAAEATASAYAVYAAACEAEGDVPKRRVSSDQEEVWRRLQDPSHEFLSAVERESLPRTEADALAALKREREE